MPFPSPQLSESATACGVCPEEMYRRGRRPTGHFFAVWHCQSSLPVHKRNPGNHFHLHIKGSGSYTEKKPNTWAHIVSAELLSLVLLRTLFPPLLIPTSSSFSPTWIFFTIPKSVRNSVLLSSMLFRKALSILLSSLCHKDTTYLATIPFQGHCLFREVSLYIQTLDSLDLGILSVEGQNLLGDEGEHTALIIKSICFTSEN